MNEEAKQRETLSEEHKQEINEVKATRLVVQQL